MASERIFSSLKGVGLFVTQLLRIIKSSYITKAIITINRSLIMIYISSFINEQTVLIFVFGLGKQKLNRFHIHLTC